MREQDYYERGYDDEPRRSKKAKKRKRKQSGSRGERVVVTLLSLLFLTVAIVATVKYVVRAPEPVTDGEDQQTQQDGTAEDSDAIQTISNGRERKSKYCYNMLRAKIYKNGELCIKEEKHHGIQSIFRENCKSRIR